MKSNMLVFAASCAATIALLIGCSPAPKAPSIPTNQSIPSLKPNAASSTEVGLAVMSELSHLERAIKPFAGTAPVFDSSDCRQTVVTTRALRETRWKCGMNPEDVSPLGERHEVEGTETVTYDEETLTLIYKGQFKTRNYEASLPRSSAHTLTTTRNIRINFKATTPGSVESATQARVFVSTFATVENATSAWGGSNWSLSLNGNLQREGAAWSITPGAELTFSGALFGHDDQREQILAAGDFKFVSVSNTKLAGIETQNGCTKPESEWHLEASGGGNNFDSEMRTTSGGVQVSGASLINWPTKLCDRP